MGAARGIESLFSLPPLLLPHFLDAPLQLPPELTLIYLRPMRLGRLTNQSTICSFSLLANAATRGPFFAADEFPAFEVY
jgi:hypothetical protein